VSPRLTPYRLKGKKGVRRHTSPYRLKNYVVHPPLPQHATERHCCRLPDTTSLPIRCDPPPPAVVASSHGLLTPIPSSPSHRTSPEFPWPPADPFRRRKSPSRSASTTSTLRRRSVNSATSYPCPECHPFHGGALSEDQPRFQPPASGRTSRHHGRAGHAERVCTQAGLAIWLLGWARPKTWAKRLAQCCSPLFHFVFRFKISRKFCKLLKYIKNGVDLGKIQNNFY
jgi:hypothetical protein